MSIIVIDNENALTRLNETFINVEKGLPVPIENSVLYPKLKNLLYIEIVKFCREQVELKEDLNILRLSVGEALSEIEIRQYLDSLKEKYNNDNNNIGIDYHIESTRIDFGVSVVAVIKRDEIFMKQFIFRFKKKDISFNLTGLSSSGIPSDEGEIV